MREEVTVALQPSTASAVPPHREERWIDHLVPALRVTAVTLVLSGLVYPLLMTGVAQVLFHHRASGSLVSDAAGKVIGSELLAQGFAGAVYFQPRPSAAGDKGYDPMASGGSNLGPTSKKLRDGAAADLGGAPEGQSGRARPSASRAGHGLRKRPRPAPISRGDALAGAARRGGAQRGAGARARAGGGECGRARSRHPRGASGERPPLEPRARPAIRRTTSPCAPRGGPGAGSRREVTMPLVRFDVRAGGDLVHEILRCQRRYDEARKVRTVLLIVPLATSAFAWMLLANEVRARSSLRPLALASWIAAAVPRGACWAVESYWRRRRDGAARASERQ